MSDAFWTGFFAVCIALVNVYGLRKISRVQKQSEQNSVKLNRVETGLKQNTEITQGVAKAVNGGQTCGFVAPSESISGRLNALQLSMVGEIAGLKKRLEIQTQEISELKSQLAATEKLC